MRRLFIQCSSAPNGYRHRQVRLKEVAIVSKEKGVRSHITVLLLQQVSEALLSFCTRLRVYLRRVISICFGYQKCLRALLRQTLRRCAPHRHIIPSRLGGFPSPRRSRLHQRRTNSSGGGAALEAEGALALFAHLYLCLLLSVPPLPLMGRAVALSRRRTVALGCPQFPAQPLQRALLRRHRHRLGVPQSMQIIVAAPRKLAH